MDDSERPDPDDFRGSLDDRFDDYMEYMGDNSPYDWESLQEFYDDLHNDDVDHGPDSDLAHFLEDVGFRDVDWDWDVGDTPDS